MTMLHKERGVTHKHFNYYHQRLVSSCYSMRRSIFERSLKANRRFDQTLYFLNCVPLYIHKLLLTCPKYPYVRITPYMWETSLDVSSQFHVYIITHSQLTQSYSISFSPHTYSCTLLTINTRVDHLNANKSCRLYSCLS